MNSFFFILVCLAYEMAASYFMPSNGIIITKKSVREGGGRKNQKFNWAPKSSSHSLLLTSSDMQISYSGRTARTKPSLWTTTTVKERETKREIFRPCLSSLFQKGNAWKQKRSPRLEEKRKISYSNSSRSSKQFLKLFLSLLLAMYSSRPSPIANYGSLVVSSGLLLLLLGIYKEF